MGININDLNNSLNPVGASLLSGNETILDNLRELSDEELKTCGGGKKGGDSIVVTGVNSGVPVAGFPVTGFPVTGSGGGDITFNDGSTSTSNSRANA